jgi:hypothetical protein
MARFKSNTMTQCRLSRHTGRGDKMTIGWIESCFARVGNILEDEDKDIWEVVDVYATQPTEYIIKHERDYAKQRNGSDI